MMTEPFRILSPKKSVLYVLFALAILLPQLCDAQIYKRTFGIRMDENVVGLSLTQRLTPAISLEGIADLARNDIRAKGHLRFHKKILGRRLNFYPGVGWQTGNLKGTGAYNGPSMVLGAEYKFMLFPIVVSYDFNIDGFLSDSHPDWVQFQSVLSIKFILVKDKRKLFKRKDVSRRDLYGD